MTNDIDDKLLEQQEQEQKEQDNLGSQFQAGGNGHGQVIEIDPTVDLNPFIGDRDYAEYIVDNAKKTVKREDALIRQIVYVALSKDSDNPLNLAVLATTSEGKTHAVVETLKPFEKLGLWVIGSMSPKVIIRQNGILVDSNNDLSDDDMEVVNQAQKIESPSKCISFLISSISGLGHRDNILQHSKIIVPKNLEPIPEKWLELYISGLFQYPDANETFEIIDKNERKVCIYGFIEWYLRGNRNLHGYVSNAAFYNNDNEILVQLKDLEKFDRKRCKTLSLSCNLDTRDTTSSSPDQEDTL